MRFVPNDFMFQRDTMDEPREASFQAQTASWSKFQNSKQLAALFSF